MKKRFTLIELLVTLSIIGLLASVTVFNSKYFVRKANDTRTLKIIDAYRVSLKIYFLDNSGEYPEKLKDLYPKYIDKIITNIINKNNVLKINYNKESGKIYLKVISGDKLDYLGRLYEEY